MAYRRVPAGAPTVKQDTRARLKEVACSYSLLHVALMFVSFCGIGWLWEVLVDLVLKGQFINRGMLYGPWLPLYGVIGLFLVVLLDYWKKKPLFVYPLAVLISGIVEYSVSWLVEMATGERWWDYSQYMFHLNGRVFLVGLLFFGLVGMVGVCWLAPGLDKLFSRISLRTKRIVCGVLLSAMAVDLAFAVIQPNMHAVLTAL